MPQVEVEPALPRICSRQRNSDNMPSGTLSEYYQCFISVPLFGHLLSEMASQFTFHHQTALNGICSLLVTLSLPSLDSIPGETNTWKIK